uniref:Histone domain-containing protein n=1 Tax=Heterorhabditis bacteriophora TaxID=37862 RepID=A0A1I7XFM2_HETBA
MVRVNRNRVSPIPPDTVKVETTTNAQGSTGIHSISSKETKMMKSILKKKKKLSFSSHIHKVLKQVHPDCRMSRKAMSIMESMVNDVFERFINEALTIQNYNGKKTMTSRVPKFAVITLEDGIDIACLNSLLLSVGCTNVMFLENLEEYFNKTVPQSIAISDHISSSCSGEISNDNVCKATAATATAIILRSSDPDNVSLYSDFDRYSPSHNSGTLLTKRGIEEISVCRWWNLARHASSHIKVKSFKCVGCKYQKDDRQTVRHHMVMVHGQDFTSTDPIDNNCPELKELRKVLTALCFPKARTDWQVPYILPNLDMLLKLQKDNNITRHRCIDCHVRYVSIRNDMISEEASSLFVLHLIDKHSSECILFKCSKCGYRSIDKMGFLQLQMPLYNLLSAPVQSPAEDNVLEKLRGKERTLTIVASHDEFILRYVI